MSEKTEFNAHVPGLVVLITGCLLMHFEAAGNLV